MANVAQSYSFRDFTSQVSTTRVFTNTAVESTNIQATLAALTSAAVVAARGNNNQPDTGAVGANTTYPNVEDKAVIIFKGVGGSTHKYSIPAPLAAIFAADGETVNLANAAVAAFTAAMIANGRDANGALLISVSKGHRARRQSKKG